MEVRWDQGRGVSKAPLQLVHDHAGVPAVYETGPGLKQGALNNISSALRDKAAGASVSELFLTGLVQHGSYGEGEIPADLPVEAHERFVEGRHNILNGRTLNERCVLYRHLHTRAAGTSGKAQDGSSHYSRAQLASHSHPPRLLLVKPKLR